ncbi:MAG: hypothetical protein V4617_04490 [Gemmatimonadota bacterium]
MTTTGLDPDLDGYVVIVDGGTPREIVPNGALTLSGVSAGSHEVHLAGVASNCGLDAGTGRRTSVQTGRLNVLKFAVVCREIERAPGTLRLTVSTSGLRADTNGYLAVAERGDRRSVASVPVTGTVEMAVAAGVYTVVLEDVQANCGVERVPAGNATGVEVAPRATVALSFAISCVEPPSGQLAFVREGQIYLANTDGTGVIRLTSGPGDADPSWSPDGRRLAFARARVPRDSAGVPRWDLYVMNVDGSGLTRRSSPASAHAPAWSPDGRRIAFTSTCGWQGCIYMTSADDDGTTPMRVGFERGFHDSPAWSPNGQQIAFTSDWRAYDFVYDLYVTRSDGSGEPIALLAGPFGMGQTFTYYFQPAWSPDGGRLALVVCEKTWEWCFPRSAIAVVKADGSGLTRLAASSGYARPTWSPDGLTIAYSSSSCRGCEGTIRYVRADGSYGGELMANGHSPAWRP